MSYNYEVNVSRGEAFGLFREMWAKVKNKSDYESAEDYLLTGSFEADARKEMVCDDEEYLDAYFDEVCDVLYGYNFFKRCKL